MYRPESTKVAYMRLIEELDKIGPFVIEEKKTSLHMLAGRFAFLGVHPRPGGIRLNLVLNRRLVGSRIHNSDQVSGTTFHNEVDVNVPQEFNEELIGWIKEAYTLRTASQPVVSAKVAPSEAVPETVTEANPKPKPKTSNPKSTKKTTSKKKSS
jgi:hypothetical protein